MSRLNRMNVEELKLFLITLLEEKKLDKTIDLNKAISDRFKVILFDKKDVTLVGLYGEDMYENANDFMAIEDMFEGELIEDCGEDFDLKLRLNNDCCSFNYVKMVLGDNTYLVPIHQLINSNYTHEAYLNLNELILEEELLNNFPKGRMLGYYYNTTMLKHMVEIKASLEEDESLNYYLGNKCNVGKVSRDFNICDIPDYLGHSIVDCKDYIEIKDYEDAKFVIKKLSNDKVDFDTIEMVG